MHPSTPYNYTESVILVKFTAVLARWLNYLSSTTAIRLLYLCCESGIYAVRHIKELRDLNISRWYILLEILNIQSCRVFANQVIASYMVNIFYNVLSYDISISVYLIAVLHLFPFFRELSCGGDQLAN